MVSRGKQRKAATAPRRRAAQGSEQSERTSRQDSAHAASLVRRFPAEEDL